MLIQKKTILEDLVTVHENTISDQGICCSFLQNLLLDTTLPKNNSIHFYSHSQKSQYET